MQEMHEADGGAAFVPRLPDILDTRQLSGHLTQVVTMTPKTVFMDKFSLSETL